MVDPVPVSQKTDSIGHWIGSVNRLKWVGEACPEVKRQPGVAVRLNILTSRDASSRPSSFSLEEIMPRVCSMCRCSRHSASPFEMKQGPLSESSRVREVRPPY
jgi:hypothetical protein